MFSFSLKLSQVRVLLELDKHEQGEITLFFWVGCDLRHQVLRPLLAYCTAPDDRW
jgi:hypothetical protein